MSQDYQNVTSVGFQISEDGQRIWVCIDGSCVLRVKGIKHFGFTDLRKMLQEEQEEVDGAFTFKHDRPTRIDEVECKAFQAYHSMALSDATTRRTRLEAATSPPGTNMYPGMSVAQIAKELGVSKSEVRRRKQAGLI